MLRETEPVLLSRSDGIVNFSDQTVLLFLRHVRQAWDLLLRSSLYNTVVVGISWVLIDLIVVNLQIRDHLGLTLNLLVLVRIQLFHFVFFALVSESYHGAEEYVQRLFQNIVFLEPLPVYRGFALSSLIQEIDI